MTPTDDLARQHSVEAIEARLGSTPGHSYLGDFVLGAVDGTVTTFAIVAGAAGAGLSGAIALVLGLANVVADGFSMAAGTYLKGRADRHHVDRIRRMEEQHVAEIPEGEREEIRQIFAGKGFDGRVLEDAVDVITRDRRRWIDTMLTEEWGLPLHVPSPIRTALATFTAFVLTGMIPLAPLGLAAVLARSSMFSLSAVLTGLTFFSIGFVRGRLTDRSPFWAGVETLVIGGAAATLAYGVGVWLRGFAAG